MPDHTSKDFDQSIERARSLVDLLAARVERQLDDAIEALRSGSASLIEQVLRHESEVNALEREIDELTEQIIARRQPAARDLRLLVALAGATTDLERAGDEAKKIALYVRALAGGGRSLLRRVAELEPMAGVVRAMLRQAVRILQTLDPHAAAALVRRDLEANSAFRAVLARLVSLMVEEPRAISPCLDILFLAKSLERIGDHAKNIGEHTVYAAVGKDVRHFTAQEIELALRR
jgi:phosphate transport system protein